MECPTQEKVVSLFDELEERLGLNDFQRVFPSILTDRDPCFINYLGIEFSSTSGEQRTKVIYCDTFCSSQKGNVENTNKQLRKCFPKGRSIDNLSQDEVDEIVHIINEQRIASLGGSSPLEAFEKIYGKVLLTHLFKK